MSTATTPAKHPPASAFVPAELDGTKWENLAPYYEQLVGRTVHDAAALERLLLDRSELDACAEEAAANLYIEMTRHTDDKLAQQRYLGFVEAVEPELKKVGFALDRKIVESGGTVKNFASAPSSIPPNSIAAVPSSTMPSLIMAGSVANCARSSGSVVFNSTAA
jgi:hypothetical protein